MTDEIKPTEVTTETPEITPAVIPAVAATPTREDSRDRRGGNRPRGGDRGPRRGGKRDERARSEFDQKIVAIRRVTRVMAGGRRFNFSVAIVDGDRKGRVGVGLGKGADTSLAIDKALRDAKKHMIRVPLTKEGRIPHEVQTKFASSEIVMKPAPGKGLVAGSSARTVLELAGVKDVSAKLLSRSKNGLNNARVAIEALREFAKKGPILPSKVE